MYESENIEFKQSWHDDYLKWICGFANASGGKLLIGINDDGKVIGISNFTTLMEDIPSKVRNLMGVTVTVNLLRKNELFYLEIITPSYSTPISLRGRYYFRSGSTNTELTGNALNEFLMRKFRKTWDDVTEDDFSADQLNFQTIEDFKNLAVDRLPGIRAEHDPIILLKKLNLIQDGKFKRACILLFGSNPQRYFKQSHIKIGKFSSDVDVLTSDIVEGNLFQQIDQALNILTTKYLLSPISYDGIHRREKLEYPYLALREAILNSIIHRDYHTTSAVQIRLFYDKLIIMNDGTLPEELSIEDLKVIHLSKPRNILLADIFYKAGFIESWGRGTLKIIAECVGQDMPEPKFESRNHLFSVAFLKADPKTDLKTDLKTDPKTDPKTDLKATTENQIMTIISLNSKVSIREISAQIGKGVTVTKEYIDKLKKNGLLKRIGPAKGGHWLVVQN